MELDARLHVFRADLADQRLQGKVAADRFVTGYAAQIIHPSTALYKLPQHGLAAETTLLWGETVRVFDRADDFAWVQADQDDYVGYVDAASLGPLETPTHWVAVNQSHLYDLPNLKTPPRHSFGFGCRVAIMDRPAIKGFLPVVGGGWIYQRHLVPMAMRFADHLAIAQRFMGVPYLWGGRDTARGIDCSALVQLSLQACGLPLPRDSDQQRMGTGPQIDWARCPVIAEESTLDNLTLRAGDIVFFPGHVGIMQDHHHIIHANASQMMVSVDPLERLVGGGQVADRLKILRVRRPVLADRLL
jgi:cell wall-associated NlpC family hydrolase